jgi:hypothetical protein
MVYPLHVFQCDSLDFKCCRQGFSDMKLCVQDALLIVQTSLSLPTPRLCRNQLAHHLPSGQYISANRPSVL